MMVDQDAARPLDVLGQAAETLGLGGVEDGDRVGAVQRVRGRRVLLDEHRDVPEEES